MRRVDVLAVRRATISVAAVLLLAASGCAGRGEAGSPQALRVVEVSGAVTAAIGGEAFRPLRRGSALESGDRIRTGRGGSIRFAGDRGIKIEVAPRTEATVISGRGLSLARGAALAESAGNAPAALESQGVSAELRRGAMRMDRRLSVRIGVYVGRARVTGGNESLDVPRFREVVLGAGALPRTARPLRIKGTDAWDRRLAGDALDLDRELGNLGRGFDAQYGERASSGDFFRRFVELPSTAFLAPYLAEIRTSDILIGLVLASAAGDPQAEFAGIMRLRLEGATWGLIVLERGVNPPEIVARVVRAVAGLPVRPSPPPQPAGSGAGGGTSGGGGSPGGTGGGGGGGGRPSPSPAPTRGGSPSPGPSPSPEPSCDPIAGLIDPECREALSLPG